MTHGRHGVQAARRLEGLPERRARLLRPDAVRLVGGTRADRGAGQLDPAQGARRASSESEDGDPLRPGRPLPLARVGLHLRGERASEKHVGQGMQPRQRRDGGLLRQAGERVLPLAGLEGRRPRRIHAAARRGAQVPPGGTDRVPPGMEEPDGVQEGPGLRGLGPRKCPHPPHWAQNNPQHKKPQHPSESRRHQVFFLPHFSRSADNGPKFTQRESISSTRRSLYTDEELYLRFCWARIDMKTLCHEAIARSGPPPGESARDNVNFGPTESYPQREEVSGSNFFLSRPKRTVMWKRRLRITDMAGHIPSIVHAWHRTSACFVR